MDNLSFPSQSSRLPAFQEGTITSFMVVLVFALTLVLVLVYVAVVWLVLVKALLGRWWREGKGGGEDVEAQKILI